MRQDPETAEFDARRRFGHGIHGEILAEISRNFTVFRMPILGRRVRSWTEPGHPHAARAGGPRQATHRRVCDQFGGLVDTDKDLVNCRICSMSSPATSSTSATGKPRCWTGAASKMAGALPPRCPLLDGRADQARPTTSASSFKPRCTTQTTAEEWSQKI